MDTFDDNRPCPGPDGEIMSIREMFVSWPILNISIN